MPIRPPSSAPLPHDDELALICAVAGNRYALPLSDVVEVTRSVAVTAPSGRTDAILGWIDLRGTLIPVISARVALTLPARPVTLSDRFVVVRIGPRFAAIQVDAVEGVAPIATQVDSVLESDPGWAMTRDSGSAAASAMVTRLDIRRFLPSVQEVQPVAGRS